MPTVSSFVTTASLSRTKQSVVLEMSFPPLTFICKVCQQDLRFAARYCPEDFSDGDTTVQKKASIGNSIGHHT